MAQNTEQNRTRKFYCSFIPDSIDIFAVFMKRDNVRIDSSTQEIFIRLHEWTNGHIWKNLVFVFGRTERSSVKQSERFFESTSITNGTK